MSPLSVHFEAGDVPKPKLEGWCYGVGFASLLPFLGLPFAVASMILGIGKIGRKGGWMLLVLAALGATETMGLTAVYYDQIFPPAPQALSAAASTDTTANSTEITWLEPAAGFQKSQATGKPILYDFTAHWCGWCKILDGQVFEKPEYASKINSRFIPVVVMDLRQEQGRNSDDVVELQSRYKVRGFPTLVVQYPNNGTSRVLVGFAGVDQTMAFLYQ